MRSRWAAACLVFAVTAGCASDDKGDLSFVVPTEVAVDPADFLGDALCASLDGAVRAYVVTLQAYDDPEDTQAFTLGSSLPAPCSVISGFRDVVVIGKRYAALIDAYDLPAASLAPLGGITSGSRQMLHDGTPVAPRWTTQCGGDASTAPEARVNQRVFVRPCDALVDLAPSATALAIGASDVLGDDPCSVAPAVDLTVAGLPATLGLACDALPVTYDAEPGKSYLIYATTTIDGTLFGAECHAQGISGVTVRPSCSSLSATGYATISLGGLAGDPPICPDGSSYLVSLEGEPLHATPLACSASAQLGPLTPGVHFFEASIYDGTGQRVGGASCAVEIEPGKTKEAACLGAP